jgi:hypothetical protein
LELGRVNVLLVSVLVPHFEVRLLEAGDGFHPNHAAHKRAVVPKALAHSPPNHFFRLFVRTATATTTAVVVVAAAAATTTAATTAAATEVVVAYSKQTVAISLRGVCSKRVAGSCHRQRIAGGEPISTAASPPSSSATIPRGDVSTKDVAKTLEILLAILVLVLVVVIIVEPSTLLATSTWGGDVASTERPPTAL